MRTPPTFPNVAEADLNDVHEVLAAPVDVNARVNGEGLDRTQWFWFRTQYGLVLGTIPRAVNPEGVALQRRALAALDDEEIARRSEL